METVTINKKSIAKALDEDFGAENREIFTKHTSLHIEECIKIFFNAVNFDADKFLIKQGYKDDVSINSFINNKYPKEFVDLFNNVLTSRPMFAIAVVL